MPMSLNLDLTALGSGRIGATVGEFQLYKSEYDNLLRPMVRDCDTRIVCIGSRDKYGVLGHPFTFEQRKAMIEAVHGPVFTFVALDDIDTVETEDWVRYVLKAISGQGLPQPTDFYVGSESEAGWYAPAFPDTPRWATAEEHRRHDGRSDLGRRLHVLGRTPEMISAREIRTWVEQRNPRWREHVPARLWKFVEWHYPPRIRTAVQSPDKPDPNAYPVGTRLRIQGQGTILELKADLQWRPLPMRDEKADYARAQHAQTPGDRS